MVFYICLALFNGTIVSVSRTINGRLSTQVGPLKASLSNHIVGFLFLAPLLLIMGEWEFQALSEAPYLAYLGGFFGALFVAVNSYVFPRVGAMNGALLVISGQMISAVIIDCVNRSKNPSAVQCLGVFIVLLGIYLTRKSSGTAIRRGRND